ncbi:osteopetrosis-associated transmembrane protein 1 [Tachysurus fulvidraco]|uniref:osteopetrosis-associated transmembrane protein 1 n=1 Tax=Tachysurus fulvidraco TaxID=1234273 RepID=UPI000F50590D|nr:osteopetrosis-associated transmembrane protein 1 [Tachysurus fulvidraco]
MGMFTGYNCVLFLLLWRNLMFGEILVYGAVETSHMEELKPPAFNENSFFSSLSLSLSASFPGELETTNYCLELLHEFGQTYGSLAYCLVSNVRPVKVCQNCYNIYNSFQDVFKNISTGTGNQSCQDSLLRSDRLMLLYNLYISFENTWIASECTGCLSDDKKSVSNKTLYFNDRLNQSLTCFEKYQGNHTELCVECRTSYKILNDQYSNMSLCIDVEDAMNVTRHLWSKNFKCSLNREENVPVIALCSFLLFLPIIFYLSNYLHSEQKKRKLIHPSRAKSSHSQMNVQDKYN